MTYLTQEEIAYDFIKNTYPAGTRFSYRDMVRDGLFFDTCQHIDKAVSNIASKLYHSGKLKLVDHDYDYQMCGRAMNIYEVVLSDEDKFTAPTIQTPATLDQWTLEKIPLAESSDLHILLDRIETCLLIRDRLEEQKKKIYSELEETEKELLGLRRDLNKRIA